MKIGVFDSGVGGQSFANAISEALPELDILVREDSKNLPYGNKTSGQLLALVTPLLQDMIEQGCEVIVVACNTVSTKIITELRALCNVPLVAVEPMIKPAAALTHSKIIAVCATPGTLASERYDWLKQTYAADITVLEPDCSRWSAMIEANQVDMQHITDSITAVLDQGADVVVLGCTHYHWIEQEIQELCGDRAQVVQPEPATIEQLKRVLAQLA